MQPAQQARGLATFPVTIALVAANLIVFVVQMMSGADPLEPSTQDILRLGGNLAPLTLTGDSWRLVTSMFLHIGILHLLANMYMLIVAGPAVERLLGSVNHAVIYLLSGLAGGLTSAMWYGHHEVSHLDPQMLMLGVAQSVSSLELVVSAGASGALMGMAAAALVGRLVLPPDVLAEHDVPAKALGQVVLISLAQGFMGNGVDNAAHIGGFLAGAVLALPLMKAREWPGTIRAVAVLAIAAAGAGAVAASVNQGGNAQLRELRQQVMEELHAPPSGAAAAPSDDR